MWTRARVEPRAWRIWLTYHLFAFTLLLFRLPSLRAAGAVFAQIAHLPSSGVARALAALVFAPAALLLYAQASRARAAWERFQPRSSWQAAGYGVALALALTACAIFAAPPAEFIYWHF